MALLYAHFIHRPGQAHTLYSRERGKMSALYIPPGAACCSHQPSAYTFVLQREIPTALEMHGQCLIALLAGLFPSARGFGSVRQGCCFEFVEHVEEGATALTSWTRSFCYGQHVGGWDPYSISKADCLEEAGVFRDCSQVCAPPLHPRPRGSRHPAPALSTAPTPKGIVAATRERSNNNASKPFATT